MLEDRRSMFYVSLSIRNYFKPKLFYLLFNYFRARQRNKHAVKHPLQFDYI